jgi:predicted  nucleic acid-binding Zn-ribbon protein
MEVEKAQSTWMDQVEREIERLLEELYKLYERSVTLGYSANELKSVVREIERHLGEVEDAIQSAQALLQRLR